MKIINNRFLEVVFLLCIILYFDFYSFGSIKERLCILNMGEFYYQDFPRYDTIYNNEKLYKLGKQTNVIDRYWVYEKNKDIKSIGVTIGYFSTYEKQGARNYFRSRLRSGKIIEGKQEGEWLTSEVKQNNNYTCRKEYFKNGIREGEYTIFNKTGDTLYSTVFVNGKGVEKDYYPNGQLYYVGAKDAGYFVDTLKVYRPDGMIIRKTLYRPRSIEKLYDKEYNYKRDTNRLTEVTIYKTDNDTIYINEQYYPNGALRYREYKFKDRYKYVMDGDTGRYLENGGGYVKNGDWVRDVYSEYHIRDTITFDLIRVERRQWQEKVEE